MWALVLYAGLAAATPVMPVTKERLLLWPTKDGHGQQTPLTRSIDSLIAEAVSDLGAFDVVDQGAINLALQQQRLADQLGCDDVACYAEIAGSFNARHILTGEVFDGERVALKYYDNTPQLLDTESAPWPRHADLQQRVIKQLVQQLLTPDNLTLGEGVGSVSIETVPAGADVLIDAQRRGQSPIAELVLPAGVYSLVLALDGYEPLRKEIAVTAGQSQRFSERLAAQVGSLDVGSQPAGAACVVDGKDYGQTPCTLPELPVGEHEVELTLPGYERAAARVRVDRGQTTRHIATLVPAPVDVSILSSPSGAEVILNGEAQKQPTTYSAKLRPGVYDLRLVKTGYEDLAESIHVPVGRPFTADFTLRQGLSETERQRQRTLALWRWGLTGTAVAATGVCIWQGLRARALERDAEALRVDSGEFADTQARGERAARVADAALVGALLTGAGAGYFWVTGEF